MLNQTLFTNNMVFQYNYPIKLVGEYSPLEEVEVVIVLKDEIEFNQIYITDEKGTLNIEIPNFDCSKQSFTIHINTKSSSEKLENCKFGHVFLAMGQSNMGFPLKYIDSKEKVLSEIDISADISFLSIDDAYLKDDTIIRPLEKENTFKLNKKRFLISDIDQVLEFSAIMVVFALKYYKKVKLPIQIIDVSVGGSGIASFLNINQIEENKIINDFLVKSNVYPIKENNYNIPSGIFNEKVYPLRHLKLKGILWYQGEHHVGGYEAQLFYFEALKELIRSYRKLFNQCNLRWINIHLQNHYYEQDDNGIGISLINEAMNKASKELTEVYSLPIHDEYPNWKNKNIIEEANPIHPTNKKYIGERLASAFINPESILEVNNVIFKNDHVLVVLNQEVKADEKHLYGFTLGNKGEALTYADAFFINNNTIKVSAKGVSNPEIVTYGFFLYNMRCRIYGRNNSLLKPFKVGNYNETNIYYQPYGFEDLSTNRIEQLLSSTKFTTDNKNHLIKIGKTYKNSSIKIRNNEDSLEVFGKDKFSLDVNLKQNNHPSMFKHFKYMELTLENNSEVIVEKLIFKTNQNNEFKVNPILSHKQVYGFDISDINDFENKSIENLINEFEIIFKFKIESKFNIKSIRMYHGEVENV